MKPVVTAALVIFGLLVPVLAATHSPAWMINSHSAHAEQTNQSLVNDTQAFVTGDAPLPDVYDGRAAAHLEDVEDLVAVAEIIAFAAGLLVILGLLYNDVFFLGAAWLAGIVVVVAGGSAVSFPTVFSAFHQLLFPAGSYVFRTDSLLIRTFPAAFFLDGVKQVALGSAAVLASYVALGVIQRR